ncbi:MAG: hypothetical protein ACXWC5_30815, partial [Burkholderiales bacterium]
MNATAEGRENTNAPVAEFIAAAFDDDVLVTRNSYRRCSLVFEVAQKILGRVLVERMLFDQFCIGGW